MTELLIEWFCLYVQDVKCASLGHINYFIKSMEYSEYLRIT